jgi:hypothetical protein
MPERFQEEQREVYQETGKGREEGEKTRLTSTGEKIMIKRLSLTLGAAAAILFSGSTRAADNPALMEPVKSVYDHYLAIQTALAKDSTKEVDVHANAIAKAVKGDDMKMLPVKVAKEAEDLAKAKDLKGARAAFKPLSASLIKYLADHKAKGGAYQEAYCPMVKASWLQSGKEIKNPYMGSEMLDCGVLKN